MRICIFYRDYGPTGGVPREVKGYAKAFLHNGLEVVIYCISRKENFIFHDEGIKVRVYKRSIKSLFQLFRDFKHNIDSVKIVHVFGFLIPENIFPYFGAKSSNVAFVISPLGMLHNKVMRGKLFSLNSSIEDINKNSISGYKKIPFYKKFISILAKHAFFYIFGRRMLKNSDGLHFSSTFEENHAMHYIGNYSKPILKALPPVAIWVEGFSESENDKNFYGKLDDKSREINIVFWSRLDFHYKGLDILVKGVSYAVERVDKVNFSIFLIGPDYQGGKYLTEQAIRKCNLQNVIQIVDYKTCFPSKSPLISADAQISLSPCDGVLRTVREGLYFGIPQIVSEGTQMADLINKYRAGFVVKNQGNKRDYEVLGDYLVWLSINKQELKIQAKNTQQAVSELSDKSVSEGFKRFYNDVWLRKYNSHESVNAKN